MAAPKIIVLGSLEGQIGSAFSKLAILHSKNNFSFAIITGNLFASEDDDAITELLEGKIEVPLPVYFTVGNAPLPSQVVAKIEADEEICPNLHYLGKRSVNKTSEGVRIVTLGGQPDTTDIAALSKEQCLPFHTVQDASALRGAKSADILLTTAWPTGIQRGSLVPLSTDHSSIASTQDIAELCTALKPRYHFAGSPSDFFYEREPFLHRDEKAGDDVKITRFISMALYGNAAKAKSMYAFSLPLSNAAVEVPPNTTASPLVQQDASRKRRTEENGSSRFSDSVDREHHRHKRKRRQSPPPGPDRCFFCLSNPNISAHMCCSIGDESYLTTAKGPLSTPTTFAEQGLTFPGHFIIIPLAHEATIAGMGPVSDLESDSSKAHREMTRFRESLQAMVSSKSKHKLGAVTWEISRARNIHVHWQFMAAPAHMIRKGLVEAGFCVEAENLSYPKFSTAELPLEKQTEFGDYFRVWLWADNGEDKIKGKCLVMALDPETRFDLQFGRRVMAKLLGLEKRLIWQDCVQTEEEEKRDVEEFRNAFKEWDFTLPK